MSSLASVVTMSEGLHPAVSRLRFVQTGLEAAL